MAWPENVCSAAWGFPIILARSAEHGGSSSAPTQLPVDAAAETRHLHFGQKWVGGWVVGCWLNFKILSYVNDKIYSMKVENMKPGAAETRQKWVHT